MRKLRKIAMRKYGIFIAAFAVAATAGGITIHNIFIDKPGVEDATGYPIQYTVQEGQISQGQDYVYYYDLNLDKKWQKLIYDLCAKNNLNYPLALSFFNHESEGFKLDLICYNRDKNGKVLSHDSGIAQINSSYEDFYRRLAVQYCDLDANVKFDPLNPDHGIRAGIAGLSYYMDYWKQHGVTGEDSLYHFALNSYNQGKDEFQSYVQKTNSISRGYDRDIFSIKDKLENGIKVN